jgi:hypothetical protein
MNKIFKIFSIGAAMVCAVGFMTSCEQTDAEKDKDSTPKIEFCRVCDPQAADSLIVEAALGSRIAFIGRDMGDVQQVWFNDQKAKLNPTMVTSNSIIVDVPNTLPQQITDEVRFVTSKGHEAVYPFSVRIPAPLVLSVSCQYASPGDVMTMKGDYFLATGDIPLTVTFPGGITVEPDQYTKEMLMVTVPQGATEEGYIKLTSENGTSTVPFKFLETDGMICDFEPGGYENSWGLGGYSDEDGVSGRYLNFKKAQAGAWAWDNAMNWAYWNAASGKPIANGDLSKLAVRFETNIVSWANLPMIMWFFKEDEKVDVDGTEAQAHWMPWLSLGGDTPFTTNGWTTVTIPLTDFKYDKEGKEDNRVIGNISEYYNFGMMIFGAFTPGTMAFDIDVRVDNIRIVEID